MMSQFLNSFERDVARGASSRPFASVRERDHSTDPGATSSGATQAWWVWIGPAIPADRSTSVNTLRFSRQSPDATARPSFEFRQEAAS